MGLPISDSNEPAAGSKTHMPVLYRKPWKKEIIEESSGDEKDSTYVQETNDNIYEELNLSRSFVEQIYEEII